MPPLPLRRTARLLLGCMALGALGAVLGATIGPATLAAPEPPQPFGEGVTRLGCLRFSIESHRGGRRGMLPDDWVTLALANRCPFSVRHLEVALVFTDPQGRFFGASFWVLGRGVRLPPGETLRDRYAIPNPDGRVALGWQVRVLQAEGWREGGWRALEASTRQKAPPGS